MALYFFHLRDGEDVLLDPEGVEFSDLAAIGKNALTAARSILHDAAESARTSLSSAPSPGERQLRGRRGGLA